MMSSEPVDIGQRVEIERARANRDGHAFSLLLFEIEESGPDAEARMTHLWRTCAANLRVCDAWGRYGGDRYGVLLALADEATALQLWSVLWRGAPGAPPAVELRYFKPRVPSGITRMSGQEVRPPLPEEAEVYVDPRGVPALLTEELPRWKRAIDVAASSVGIALLLPVFAAVALAVKATSPGPALFRQQRTGLGLRRFEILKFRTMIVGAQKQQHQLGELNEMSGPLFKSDQDPRLTSIGSFLRAASLDELPQLWNVLRGDMTLIGPRALSPYPDQYEPWQLERFVKTPGVACSWQAYRRAETDFDEWMREDVRFVREDPSFLQDFRLLFATLRGVLSRDGAR